MSFNDYIYWQTLQETGKTPEEIYEYEHPKVVRCKECKWSKPNREGDYDCRCHIPIFRVAADDYCSNGERQTESGLLTCKGCKYAEPYKNGMKKCTLNGQIMSDNGFCTERSE